MVGERKKKVCIKYLLWDVLCGVEVRLFVNRPTVLHLLKLLLIHKYSSVKTKNNLLST